MTVLEKLLLCEKTPHEKSYLNILNSNQDIDNLRFFAFIIVHGNLMSFGDAILQCITFCITNLNMLEFLGQLF
jgi:hypothetical protein